jgi:ATP-dependent DNA helicase RecQ
VESVRRIVKQIWGYDALLPLQEEAIGAVLARRDSIVILPTGGGKSLCYQAPAAALGKLAVVVSPLISLMKDQVDGLTAAGVPAAVVGLVM